MCDNMKHKEECMNYETVILEMLTRIQALEKQVEWLSKSSDERVEVQAKSIDEGKIESIKKSIEDSYTKSIVKIGTIEIRNYIEELKKEAIKDRKNSIVLIANDIHKSLNLKNSMPQVCNAMRQKMGPDDKVLHETPSGYSSTLEIEYYLK